MPHTRPDRRRAPSALLLCIAVTICAAPAATAQELEPRAYTAAPIGVNFLVIATGRSSGGVLVDPSLPVDDVEANIESLAVGVGRTMNLFGRTALALAAVPYAWAEASGSVGEDRRSISRSGFTDPRLKFSVNLRGGRALTAREFARSARSAMIVGVSLAVAPPLGQYRPSRLINLGANRWSFKPEIGVSRAVGRWTIDGYSGVFLFTTNDHFYTGASVRTQQPILALQAHASYTLRPQLWAAFDATWYSGGTTSVDGVKKGDLQRNSRVGATLSMPFARRQSLKISGSSGATTRIGADFKTVGIAWQLTWFD